MSKYIENNLRKDEQVEIEAKFSPLCFMGQLLWMIVAIIGAILWQKLIDYCQSVDPAPDVVMSILLVLKWILVLSGVLPFIFQIINIRNCCLVVTNKRVLGKKGVLSIMAVDIPIEKVDHVSVSSSLFGNIFHYQNLEVKTANVEITGNGVSRPNAFGGIKNANDFRNYLTDAIEKHQEQARKAQAEEIARAMNK